MGDLKVGDIVARKSYGLDVFFKVIAIKDNGKEKIVTLKGISYRIEADAPESDLIVQNEQRVRENNMRCDRMVENKLRSAHALEIPILRKKAHFRNTSKDDARSFSRPGNVLHLDGDSDYVETCLRKYKEFGIEAIGKHVPEKDQPSKVYGLLQQYKPDILVLTGHDGVIKGKSDYLSLDSYRNSRYYVDAVKEARRYNGDLDGLVIFAGACQSLYDRIIKAGANFASSPYRVLIHALDPVIVCQKVAFTSIDKIISPMDVINKTTKGVEGVGGIQTRGKYRDGYPLEPHTHD